METIIRIIIKIFQEIFEKDNQRQQQDAARRAEILRQWQKNRQAAQANQPQQQGQRRPSPGRPGSQAGGRGAPRTFFERMDAILNELNEPLQQAPAPKRPKAVPKPPPPPPPKPARKAMPVIAEVKPAKKKGTFELPGKTPLQQMIYAKVILDPCKALEEEGSRF